jgi:hypothetical protein
MKKVGLRAHHCMFEKEGLGLVVVAQSRRTSPERIVEAAMRTDNARKSGEQISLTETDDTEPLS